MLFQVGSYLFCKPSELRFCQDNASCKFRNGMPIRETFEQFLSKAVCSRDIEMMRVVVYGGELYCISTSATLHFLDLC